MCHPSWGRALAAAQRRSELARLSSVCDRIDREFARPLDVEALGGADQIARPVRNQEAALAEPQLA